MPPWLKSLGFQDPHTAQQAARFMQGAHHKEMELIRLPNQELMLGRGGKIFSTLQPDSPVHIINLAHGNRLFRHDNFIISTAGITPQGEIDHPLGGGCQNRAFCNFNEMSHTHDAFAEDIFSVAEEVGGDLDVDTGFAHAYAEEHGIDSPASVFAEVGPEHIGPYADELGLNFLMRPTGNFADILKHEGSGIIAADTTHKNLGTHLVAFRDGLQIVPSVDQLIKDKYLYDYLNDYDFRYMDEIPAMVDNTRLMYLITRGDPKWATQQQRRHPHVHVAENSHPITPEDYFRRR